MSQATPRHRIIEPIIKTSLTRHSNDNITTLVFYRTDDPSVRDGFMIFSSDLRYKIPKFNAPSTICHYGGIIVEVKFVFPNDHKIFLERMMFTTLDNAKMWFIERFTIVVQSFKKKDYKFRDEPMKLNPTLEQLLYWRDVKHQVIWKAEGFNIQLSLIRHSES